LHNKIILLFSVPCETLNMYRQVCVCVCVCVRFGHKCEEMTGGQTDLHNVELRKNL